MRMTRKTINDFLQKMEQLKHIGETIRTLMAKHERELLAMAEAEIVAIDDGLRRIAELRDRFGNTGLLVPSIVQQLHRAENCYLEQRAAQMAARDELRGMLAEGGAA